jgi:hypothetical protein
MAIQRVYTSGTVRVCVFSRDGGHIEHILPIQAVVMFPCGFRLTDVLCTRGRGLLVGFFLGAFAEMRKAAINFVISLCPFVCLSVRPHATTRLPLYVFSLNLIFGYFTIVCRENSCFL